MSTTEQFLNKYRGQVRPEWLIPQVHKAFGIDPEFLIKFNTTKKLLQRSMDSWADMILTQLIQEEHLSPRFPDHEVVIFRNLFEAHKVAVLYSGFDARYFDSIDDIGLFFIRHNVLPLVVVGSIKRQLDIVLAELSSSSNASGRLAMVSALVTFLAVEINQIQRVYISYHTIQNEEIAAIDKKFNQRVRD